MRFRDLLFGGMMGGVVLCGGCKEAGRREQPIPAKTATAWASWRSAMNERFTPDERREFDAMLQEIKLRVMGDREATGSAAIEQAMRARIDGRTFREVLVMGYQFKWERFDAERMALENAIRQNTQLTTKPGDTASADYLAERRRQQLARVEGLKAEVRLAEEKLTALGSTPPVLTPDEMPVLLRTE